MKQISIIIGLISLAVVGGCTNTPEHQHPDYAPVELDYSNQTAAAPTGAIYQVTSNISLFEDLKARQVGDIVTVILAEATNAAKSSDTSLDKSNANVINNPLLAGQLRTLGNASNLGFDLSSENAFSGESSSNQSNSLKGSIAVTVAKVLPNGNLYVQGEKWIHLNQGKEYIRLRGLIRPVDISSANTILSTQVADARISYGGTGAPAEVNVAGLLSRFFFSPLWPF